MSHIKIETYKDRQIVLHKSSGEFHTMTKKGNLSQDGWPSLVSLREQIDKREERVPRRYSIRGLRCYLLNGKDFEIRQLESIKFDRRGGDPRLTTKTGASYSVRWTCRPRIYKMDDRMIPIVKEAIKGVSEARDLLREREEHLSNITAGTGLLVPGVHTWKDKEKARQAAEDEIRAYLKGDK